MAAPLGLHRLPRGFTEVAHSTSLITVLQLTCDCKQVSAVCGSALARHLLTASLLLCSTF